MLDPAGRIFIAIGILAIVWLLFRLIYALLRSNLETLLYEAALRLTATADMIGLVRKTWTPQLNHRRTLQSSTTLYSQIGGSSTWDYSVELQKLSER